MQPYIPMCTVHTGIHTTGKQVNAAGAPKKNNDA